MISIYKKLEDRPLSWSQIYCFNNNIEEWHDRYILGKKSVTTPEMEFGKIFAKSCEDRKPMAPVTLYSVTEQCLSVKFGDIPLIGYLDTYEPLKGFIDHKTSGKGWTQKRANDHGQLKMYALMLYLLYKIKPENLSIAIECVQTQKKDGIISLVEPVVVQRFDVKITMADILNFGNYIKTTVDKMERYAQVMD